MSGFGRRTRDIETYRPADHQFGQIRFGKISRVAAPHNLALTQHVYMICNFKDFMQFMGLSSLVEAVVIQNRREYYAKPFSENTRVLDFLKI